jgi:hypothetical protein
MVALLDHPVQEDFERHGVYAYAARLEKVAITIPLTIHIMHHMVIVIPPDGGLEIVEREALLFLGISFGFFNLTDHPTIHIVLCSVSVDI